MGNPLYVNRLTRKEIYELAAQLVKGEMGLAWTTDRVGVEASFGLMLSMVMQGDLAPETREFNRVGAFYAPMSSALPVMSNGYPIYTQMRFVHVNDVRRLWSRIQVIQAIMNGDE